LEKETEKWLADLVFKLEPERIYVCTEGQIVGYFWNRKKKQLHFISQKEVDKMTRKGLVWRRLGEEWIGEKTKKRS